MFQINNVAIFNKQLPNVGFRATNPIKPFLNDGYTNGLCRDSFSVQTPAQAIFEKYGNENAILNVINSNERLKKLLSDYNLPLKVNLAELDKLRKGHLTETRVVASKICSQLPKEIRQEVNQSELQQAAMLHDFGKILIPDKILNKSGTLNVNEREIMQLHSEIGYELLKECNRLNEHTLNMIKYHHQTPANRGYPEINNGYDCTEIEAQILNIADKYSALTEKRSYKDSYTKEEALKIIKQDVENENILPAVYEALEKSVRQNII